MQAHRKGIGLYFFCQRLCPLRSQFWVKGECRAHFVRHVGKIPFALIEAFEVNERPDIGTAVCLQGIEVLLAFENGFEKEKFHNFLYYLIDAEFIFGQFEYAVHFVAVVHFVVHHIREVNSRVREATAHIQVHGVNEHLVAQPASHFYETHIYNMYRSIFS